MTTQNFSDLGLHQELVEGLTALGFSEPTAIQSAAIPKLIAGQDVIGQAQTGTGKTAAFSLPILQNLEDGLNAPQALIVSPTRELASQVAQAIYSYSETLGVRVLPVYGGQSYDRQIRRLKKGVDIVVGTPGRLIDLMNRGVLKLGELKTLVLDEADEMLSMGFVEDIEAILANTPEDRQTALFSATMPKEIRRLATQYMRDPETITIETKQLTVASIDQRYYLVNEKDKLAALTRFFEVEEITRAIIFARTRIGTDQLANELSLRGFTAEALNGDLAQDARERVLNRFRQNKLKILVATDVAARGLDVDDISHVFNFDLPTDAEVYVHRIGRTGRAGKSGVAISLATPKEQYRLQRIERYTKQKLSKGTIPTAEEIKTYRDEKLLADFEVWLNRGRCKHEREIIERYVEEGHDPIQLAAIALKVMRSGEKQRPIEEIGPLKSGKGRAERRREDRRKQRGNESRDRGDRSERKPRRQRGEKEEGMVRLKIDVGRKEGIRPGEIVGMVASMANIPGSAIGRIDIENDHTFFDVREEHLGKVMDQQSRYRVRRQKVAVEVAK